jgi:Rho-binding antiterminator
MTTKPIACDLHDYLEIACLYHYRVRLTLKDKQLIEGVVVDINTLDKREFLIIEGAERYQIDLTDLVKLQVLTPNAKFNEVHF